MTRAGLLHFREVPSPANASPDPTRTMASRGSAARAARGPTRYRQATLFVVGIWLLGLLVLGAVLEFDRRVDETRRAQVVIAQMRNQQGALIQVAFDPAVAGTNDAPARAETKIRLGRSQEGVEWLGRHAGESRPQR